ncbi:hypothetical protein [Fodinicola acaciae]|uniref:hypothetical protein n=1 Tax=Fodinicola acaciae TaxID=2681555 RepID=UPI0013D762C5|nr:hypothetical protein [Fodinicola acaciae]
MALALVIVAATVAGLLLGSRPVTGEGRGRPAIWLLGVTALIFLNQLLFTIYVVRVHGGDPSFVARYLPAGWFDLARGPFVDALANAFPLPHLLAPTVLNVQAFLELPFVVFAYLTVCRWYGISASHLVAPTAVSWTATFCLIEWSLHNPYTIADIVIRVISMIAVVALAHRKGGSTEEAVDLVGLLIFAISAGALGYLVLVVYDTALLYNLGHLPAQLPGAIVAAVVLVAARLVRRTPGRPGIGVDTIATSFRWLILLFAVPALPLRYGLSFGSRIAEIVAALAGLVIAGFACAYGVREAFARTPGNRLASIAEIGGALLVGAAAGALITFATPGYPELKLLAGAATAVLVTTLSCGVIDRVRQRVAG